MAKYFTFFLCSTNWPHRKTLDFIDHLIDWAAPAGALDALAPVAVVDPRGKPTVTGEYKAVRAELADRPFKSLRIGTRNWRPESGAEFYFFVENQRAILPAAGTVAETGGVNGAGSALMTLTFSIRKDIWNKRVGIIPRVLSLIEDFFVESHCAYGWGHERRRVISGPFDLIEETFSTRPVRIIDFDFRQRIPDIYPYNYFSGPLVSKVEDLNSLCKVEGVTCRPLADPISELPGLALYLAEDQPETVARVSERLRHLRETEGK